MWTCEDTAPYRALACRPNQGSITVIEWFIQRAADDPMVAAGVPPRELLSASETTVFNNLHSAKRRKDWLLGRWTAKRVVQAAAVKSGAGRPADREISILAAKDGAPDVWLGEEGRLSRADFNISISHSGDIALCAAVTPAAHQLGADIELIEPRSPRFVEDFFTAEEQESVIQAPADSGDCLITAIWSGKEAALKAVRQGLRLDTRTVNCSFPTSLQSCAYGQESVDWIPFAIQWHYNTGYPQLNGWWRLWQGFILTLSLIHI